MANPCYQRILTGTVTTADVLALPDRTRNNQDTIQGHKDALTALHAEATRRGWRYAEPAINVSVDRYMALYAIHFDNVTIGGLPEHFRPWFLVDSRMGKHYRNRYYGMVEDCREPGGAAVLYCDKLGLKHTCRYDAAKDLDAALDNFVIQARRFPATIDGLRRRELTASQARDFLVKIARNNAATLSFKSVASAEKWFGKRHWIIRDEKEQGYHYGSAWNLLRIYSLLPRQLATPLLPERLWDFYLQLHPPQRW